MASGKEHSNITNILTHTTATTTLLLRYDIDTIIMLYIGCMFGFVMCPDLDIDHKTESEIKVFKFNKYIGFLWFYIWLPYAKFLPHRSIFSHLPILGTLIRYIYLSSIIYILLIILFDKGDIIYFWSINKQHIYNMFVGTCVADIGHFLADNIKIKRR